MAAGRPKKNLNFNFMKKQSEKNATANDQEIQLFSTIIQQPTTSRPNRAAKTRGIDNTAEIIKILNETDSQ